MKPRLTLALPKGRVLGEAVELLARAGYPVAPVLGEDRRLILDLPAAGLRVLLVRSGDVPSYVAHGAADAGIAGRDVIEEEDADLYEPLDLGIGRCRMVIAEPADGPAPDPHGHLRVATKYPRVTRRYLESRGLHAEVIKLGGSVELGALVGLAHRIVDLVRTGETLRANRLREVETIMEVSSRLVVNRAALKLGRAALRGLCGALAAARSDAPAGRSRPRPASAAGARP